MKLLLLLLLLLLLPETIFTVSFVGAGLGSVKTWKNQTNHRLINPPHSRASDNK